MISNRTSFVSRFPLLRWEAAKKCCREDMRGSIRGYYVLFTVAMWLLGAKKQTTLNKTLIFAKVMKETVKETLAADFSILRIHFKQKKIFCKILRNIGGFLP